MINADGCERKVHTELRGSLLAKPLREETEHIRVPAGERVDEHPPGSAVSDKPERVATDTRLVVALKVVDELVQRDGPAHVGVHPGEKLVQVRHLFL